MSQLLVPLGALAVLIGVHFIYEKFFGAEENPVYPEATNSEASSYPSYLDSDEDEDLVGNPNNDLAANPDHDWALSSLTSSSDDSWSSRSAFDDDDQFSSSGCGGMTINPATGLPMVGCIDVEGNPYGADLHSHNDLFSSSLSDLHSGSMFDGSISSSSSISSFDDSFSSLSSSSFDS